MHSSRIRSKLLQGGDSNNYENVAVLLLLYSESLASLSHSFCHFVKFAVSSCHPLIKLHFVNEYWWTIYATFMVYIPLSFLREQRRRR